MQPLRLPLLFRPSIVYWRSDAKRLALARDVDATYGQAFDRALAAGVEAIALRCKMGLEEIVVDRAVPIIG